MSDDIMNKIAQRRGMFNWLREQTNLPRYMAEAFSPVYNTQMSLLRQVDDSVRDKAKELKPLLLSGLGIHDLIKMRDKGEVSSREILESAGRLGGKKNITSLGSIEKEAKVCSQGTYVLWATEN